MTEQSKILSCIETLKSLVHDNRTQHDSYAIEYSDTGDIFTGEMQHYHLGKMQAYKNAMGMLQSMLEG